jgi:hypothetical protein
MYFHGVQVPVSMCRGGNAIFPLEVQLSFYLCLPQLQSPKVTFIYHPRGRTNVSVGWREGPARSVKTTERQPALISSSEGQKLIDDSSQRFIHRYEP